MNSAINSVLLTALSAKPVATDSVAATTYQISTARLSPRHTATSAPHARHTASIAHPHPNITAPTGETEIRIPGASKALASNVPPLITQ